MQTKDSHYTRGAAILIPKSAPFSVALQKIGVNSLTLTNVYGPNWDNEDFFRNFFFALPDLNSSQLILGGDFNCCLDPSLDHSSKKPSSPSKSSKVIQLFMEQYAVSDVWRFLKPTAKQFSFFSPVHGTFS